jgi:hypothetical protein
MVRVSKANVATRTSRLGHGIVQNARQLRCVVLFVG